MWTKDFWMAALNRAIRTVAQTMLASLGTATLLTEVNYINVMSASVLAGCISILTSIAFGIPEVEDGTDQRDNC